MMLDLSQTHFPAYIYVIGIIVFIAFSFVSYRSLAFKGVGLAALRSFALIIIWTIFWNPSITTTTTERIKPELWIALDDSESAATAHAEYKGKRDYQDVLESLRNYARSLENKADVRFFRFSRDIQPFSADDTLGLKGTQTRYDELFERFIQSSTPKAGMILVSDGNTTVGKNPLFYDKDVTKPIVTIGLGDTLQVKDLVIQQVTLPQKAYTEQDIPYSVSIAHKSTTSSTSRFTIRSGKELLYSEDLQLSPDAVFRKEGLLRFQKEGLKSIAFAVSEIESEFTAKNNSQTKSIVIEDSRLKILSVAYEIHPDVKAVRRSLSKIEDVALRSVTFLPDGNILEKTALPPPDSVSVILFQGNLSGKISNDHRIALQNLAKVRPTISVGAWSYSNPEHALFSPQISVKNPRLFKVIPQLVLSKQDHPILALPPINLSLTPFVQIPLRGVTSQTNGMILIESLFNGNLTTSPLVSIETQNGQRRVFINGKNWYLWTQNANEDIRNWTDLLFQNVLEWAHASQSTSLLEIQLPSSSFEEGEEVQVKALLRDESDRLLEDALIRFELEGEELSSSYSMQSKGSGIYTLDIGTLPAGNYSFEATARTSNQSMLDTQKGLFSITPIQEEYRTIERNENLLKNISFMTEGFYTSYQEIAKVDFSQVFTFATTQRSTTDNTPFINLWWLMIFAVLFLACEWTLKKYWGIE